MPKVPRDLVALQPDPIWIRLRVAVYQLLASAPARSIRSTLLWIQKSVFRPLRRSAMRRVALKLDRKSTGSATIRSGSRSSSSAQDETPTGTYVTAAGLIVHDRRRHETSPAERSAAIGAPANAADSARRRAQRWGRLLKPLACVPLRSVDSARFGELFLASSAFRAVTADYRPNDVSLTSIAGAAAELGGDFRTPAHQWILRHATKAEIGRLVTEGLVGNRAGATDRFDSVLIALVPAAASDLPDDEAKNVLSFLLNIVRTPVDPYESNAREIPARDAVVAMLRLRQELVAYVLDSLTLQSPLEGTTAQSTPIEAQLVAIAVRARERGGLKVLVDTAKASGAGAEELNALASLADGTIKVRPPDPEAIRPAFGSLVRCLRIVLPIVIPPGLCMTTLLLWNKHPHPTLNGHQIHFALAAIGAAEAIAAIAVLATVHVFAVQLSASRLPGAMARYSGRSWALSASYSAGITMLALTMWSPPSARRSAATAALSVGLALFLTSLLAALFTVLSRTDPARAAAAFVDSRSHAVRSSGRRLGRIQGHAVELRTAIEDTPRLEVKTHAIRDDWQVPVHAKQRGHLIPSKRGLLRLMTSEAFMSGSRLRLRQGVGTIVPAGSTVAHLIPRPDQTVDRKTIKTTQRVLALRWSGRIEDASSWVIAMLGLSTSLDAANDRGTAEQVLQSLVRLASEHVAAAARSRRVTLRQWKVRERLLADRSETSGSPAFDRGLLQTRASSAALDRDPAPVVPAVLDLIHAAVRADLSADRSRLDLVESVIVPVLNMDGEAGNAIPIVVNALPRLIESDQQLLRASSLLRAAAIRALELRVPIQFKLVLNRFDDFESEWGPKSTRVRDTVSEIAAIACRFDVEMAKDAVARLAKHYVNLDADVGLEESYSLWRVGAGAVSAGAASIAVDVAREIAEHDLGKLLPLFRNRDRVAWEASRADMLGGYLGDNPREALTEFVDFCESVLPILAAVTAHASGGLNESPSSVDSVS